MIGLLRNWISIDYFLVQYQFRNTDIATTILWSTMNNRVHNRFHNQSWVSIRSISFCNIDCFPATVRQWFEHCRFFFGGQIASAMAWYVAVPHQGIDSDPGQSNGNGCRTPFAAVSFQRRSWRCWPFQVERVVVPTKCGGFNSSLHHSDPEVLRPQWGHWGVWRGDEKVTTARWSRGDLGPQTQQDFGALAISQEDARWLDLLHADDREVQRET